MRAGSTAALGQVAAAGNGLHGGKPIKYTITNEVVLSQASQVVRLSVSGASNTGVVTTDTTAPVPGGQPSQVHIVGSGYQASYYAITIATPMDFTNGFFRYLIRCQLYSNLRGSYTWRFATNATTYAAGNYLSMTLKAGNAAPNWLVPGTYCWDSFDPLLMTATGTAPALTNIGYIVINIADSGTSVTNNFDFARLQVVAKVGTKAKCVIWHDDSVQAGMTAIKTKLDAYGWSAMEANEWEMVDAGTVYLYGTDVASMKSDGWSLGSHATTSAEHVSSVSAQVANQALRNKVRAPKYGLGGDAVDFAYWGGLNSNDAYDTVRRMYRSGRWNTSFLAQPETMPPGDPALMKGYLAGTGETFATNWQPLLTNAVTTKGLAQFVFHQQIGSDSTQAAEFDKMLTWLDQNRASIDVVTIPTALAPLL